MQSVLSGRARQCIVLRVGYAYGAVPDLPGESAEKGRALEQVQ
jgi:hypothetical protein